MKYLKLVFLLVIISHFELRLDSAGAQSDTVEYSNPTITQLVAEGLVTPINHEAVVNSVATTIDWVYADVSQIIVCLTMHDLDYSTTGPNQIPAKEIIRVVGPDGAEFQQTTASAAISNTPADRANLTVVTHFYPQAELLPPLAPGESRANYFVNLGADLPTTLDLQLKLDIEINSSPATWQRPYPGDPAELTLPVTVTLHHGITLTPATTISQNDQAITLKRLTIAPSQTLAEVCYTSPDAENWQPATRLYLDENYVLPLAHSNRVTQVPLATGALGCVEIPFAVVHRNSSPTAEFIVEFLFPAPSDPRAYWEQVSAGLIQDGIDLTLYPVSGLDYAVNSAADGLSDEDIYQRIQQQRLIVTPTVTGPWVFTLTLPSAS
ncbi:MAG: hypothetical protein JXA10_19390 [Anaerolineae bacterium]|nr:hypothetical protein [Anaerolineae bacterium]